LFGSPGKAPPAIYCSITKANFEVFTADKLPIVIFASIAIPVFLRTAQRPAALSAN
jgi:hypothetical protein